MTILSIKNLTYSIPYADTILEGINLDIHPGEFIGVLGHNGTGKTTLLDIVLGLKKASQGSIEVLNENPHAVDRKNKNQIVFLSQDVSLKGNLTIGEFLKFHSTFYPNYSVEDEAELLQAFSLKKSQKVGALSTGQQKKVQVIAGLSTRPKLIIIDEITAVMDPETRDIFFQELLKVRNKYGAAAILATNIAEDLIDRADKVLFIADKKSTLHEPGKILHLFNLGEAA